MDYKNLKDAIKAVIKKNGAQEITGQIMQDTLLSIVSKLGGNKTFAGVARPTTVPDTTDANIFYIAGENGTYVNFGGAKVENEAAVFVQVSGGTWRAIYTGIQTSHGVNNQLQQEHEYFETEIDKVSADLTQFKQTEFTDVKEDVAGNATEIAKNKSDITKINGEIATLNEATNTAADELVRIEGKVDANLKDAVVVFGPSTNTGLYKGADILSFTNDTPTSTVTAYMSQYWDKLVKLASGKISGSVYAESNNANCTGGSCIGGTQFGYLKIEIEDYQKGGLAGEVLVLSFDSGTERKEMKFSKNGSNISVKVQSYNNIVRLNEYAYDFSDSNKIDRALWTDGGKITYDNEYECISVNLIGISRISITAKASGAARVLIFGANRTLADLTNHFNKEYGGTYEANLENVIGAEVLLVSNRKNDVKLSVKATVYDKYSSNKTEKVYENLFGVDIIELEGNSGYELNGNVNHSTPGIRRIVVKRNNLVKSYLIKSKGKEGFANIVGILDNGNIEIIEETSHLTERVVTINKKYAKFGITTNNDIGSVTVYELNDRILDTLSDIVGSKALIANYSDMSVGREARLFLGSGNIAKENNFGNNYAYYIAKRNNMELLDFSFGKSALTDCKTKAAPDLNCILTDDAIISMSDKKPDYITLWYGVNDAQFNPIMQREFWLKDKYKAEIAYPMQESEIGKDGYATAEQKAEVDKAVGRVGEVDYDNADSYFFAKFVGTENDEELTTWCGALNYAFPLLMSEYPEAKIMIICPDHEKHGKLIREATIKMAEKWGVLYFDLNSLPYWYGSEKTKFENTQHDEMQWLLASGETAAPTVEGFNKSRYSYDGVRPSELGHKVISFPIGNKLING